MSEIAEIILTTPPFEPKTLDVTVTMNQAFALSEIIFALDKNSYSYLELRNLGHELHKEAKKLHK